MWHLRDDRKGTPLCGENCMEKHSKVHWTIPVEQFTGADLDFMFLSRTQGRRRSKLHCKSERSVLALKMRPFRWVKYSPIRIWLSRADLDPRDEMGTSVGWNSLLIELFWPKLCSNGSRRGWIRLWPAGLNLHFGAETDLFNLHCVFFSVRLKTHCVTFDFHPDLPHSHFTKSLLKELLSRAVGFSNRLGFLTVSCSS